MNFTTSVLATGVALLVPVLLAALGELVAERGGVINIGLEGMMVAGGYAGFLVMHDTGNAVLAMVAAVVFGMVVAAVMAAVAVYGRANQIVAGFALFVLVPGVVDFLYNDKTATLTEVPSTKVLGHLTIPVLHDIPVVGEALFSQNVFYYLAIALAIAIFFVFRRTRFGLEVAACGHNPEAAQSRGIHVLRIRSLATLCAGALAGLGGAALTVGALGSYSPGVMNGRGFVAIAIVILGRWRVVWVAAAAAVVGLSDALQLRLGDKVDVPVQLLGLVPWLVVLVLLIASYRSLGVMPRALGRSTD
jgi:simple sugar transport system permease protein